jgi:hypothetical protein
MKTSIPKMISKMIALENYAFLTPMFDSKNGNVFGGLKGIFCGGFLTPSVV